MLTPLCTHCHDDIPAICHMAPCGAQKITTLSTRGMRFKSLQAVARVTLEGLTEGIEFVQKQSRRANKYLWLQRMMAMARMTYALSSILPLLTFLPRPTQSCFRERGGWRSPLRARAAQATSTNNIVPTARLPAIWSCVRLAVCEQKLKFHHILTPRTQTQLIWTHYFSEIFLHPQLTS